MTIRSDDSQTRTGEGGIRTVAVIGAGAAGRVFAFRCVAAGFGVVLEDVMPANLRQAQQEYAELGPSPAAGASFSLASTIEDAVREADVVVDFVPDELESKLEIFCLVDRMAPPKTVILTPSNAMSITDLASCTYRGDRCFAMRGAWVKDAGGPLRLLHPAVSAPNVLRHVESFLLALGDDVRVQEDQDAPMLTKNVG